MHNFVHSSIHTIHYLETASCVSKTIVHCKALVYDLPIGNERKAMKNLEVMLAPQAQGNNLDADVDQLMQHCVFYLIDKTSLIFPNT